MNREALVCQHRGGLVEHRPHPLVRRHAPLCGLATAVDLFGTVLRLT